MSADFLVTEVQFRYESGDRAGLVASVERDGWIRVVGDDENVRRIDTIDIDDTPGTLYSGVPARYDGRWAHVLLLDGEGIVAVVGHDAVTCSPDMITATRTSSAHHVIEQGLAEATEWDAMSREVEEITTTIWDAEGR